MSAVDSIETAARLRRSITRLNRRLRQSALGGVSSGQASLLSAVDRLGEPSLGDLAAYEQIQPPSVTRIVRVLEELGYIRSRVDESDRRCTRVSTTPAGRREIEAIRHRKDEFLESRLRSLGPADQARLGDLLELLERLQEDG